MYLFLGYGEPVVHLIYNITFLFIAIFHLFILLRDKNAKYFVYDSEIKEESFQS